MRVEKDVFVPMRDGVNMALDVYKPDAEGPWPVVLVRTPYVFDAQSLVFTTAPSEHDLTVVGHPALRLYASPGEAVVDLCVRISDVQPDGSSRLAHLGNLKSSHAASHREPSNLDDGRVHPFDVQILPICSVFKQGIASELPSRAVISRSARPIPKRHRRRCISAASIRRHSSFPSFPGRKLVTDLFCLTIRKHP